MCGMLKTFASHLCVTPQSCDSSGFVQPMVALFRNDVVKAEKLPDSMNC